MINYIRVIYFNGHELSFRVGEEGVKQIECRESKDFNVTTVIIKTASKVNTYVFNKRHLIYIEIEEEKEEEKQQAIETIKSLENEIKRSKEQNKIEIDEINRLKSKIGKIYDS